MAITIMVISFAVFLLMGVPIAFVLGLVPATTLLITGTVDPLYITQLAAQKMFTGIDSAILMAVPFFIMAGNLMAAGGMTRRLLKFCNLLVGWLRGGLAYINVAISMIFAGITGAAVADTSAVGSILIPAMEEEGYDIDFAAAVTATSSTIGPIIPPSIPFIIYGSLSETSIAALFLAGMIPGLFLGVAMMGVVGYFSKKRNYPKGKTLKASEVPGVVVEAGLVLMLPLIILGGILTGVFTPTESACIACFYALIIALFVYKDVTLKRLKEIIISTGATSSLVMLVVGMANLFSWLLAIEEIPQLLTHLIMGFTENKFVVLILINILLLVIGTFMETTACLIILTPVLLPIVTKFGVDPIHFGIIMVLNLVIGLTTPPVGVCLFIACSIAETTLERVTRAIIPFLGASFVVLILCTYWEWIILALPRLFNF